MGVTDIPRNSSGNYTLPNSDQTTGGIITASLWNANFDDIASTLTTSVATNGVSSMTGPLLATSGSLSSPGYQFASSSKTGFFLAGTNQIGISTNGGSVGTFNSDQSVSFAGALTVAGATTHSGATTLTGPVTLNATSYTFGAGAGAAFYAGLNPAASIGEVIDGGGAVVTTGQKGQIYIPFPMTITKWWVMADQSGSITIDVLRANNGIPASSIVGGGTAPNLSSAQFTGNTSPSGWTSTTLAANDFVAFNVTGSPSSVTRVSITLSGVRTG